MVFVSKKKEPSEQLKMYMEMTISLYLCKQLKTFTLKLVKHKIG